MDITLIGSIFTEVGAFGDFYYMIESGKYKNALFIYNDNEESYFDKSFNAGAGNACIRKFNKYNERFSNNPMSFGIPTGTLEHGGYKNFNRRNMEIINDCINQIIQIIQTFNKKQLFYSSKDITGILGNGIFEVNIDVLRYITFKLHKLTAHNFSIIKSNPNTLFDDDYLVLLKSYNNNDDDDESQEINENI
jgi:hypothetical protein